MRNTAGSTDADRSAYPNEEHAIITVFFGGVSTVFGIPFRDLYYVVCMLIFFFVHLFSTNQLEYS